jgi:REP element-mobilizing transposase RayT
MTYNPDIHHRRSIRLREYDYRNAGAYFVTICTFQRECLFGEVVNGEMQLKEYGKIVRDEWIRSEVVRNNVSLDAFVIMPNHFHGIMLLSKGVEAMQRSGETSTAGDPHNPGDPPGRPYGESNALSGGCRGEAVPRPVLSGSIGAIIGQFKSIVTKRINTLRDNPGCPVWQRNYYEQVVRNEDDLTNIRRYIEENPMKWDMDENNPANTNKCP